MSYVNMIQAKTCEKDLFDQHFTVHTILPKTKLNKILIGPICNCNIDVVWISP